MNIEGYNSTFSRMGKCLDVGFFDDTLSGQEDQIAAGFKTFEWQDWANDLIFRQLHKIDDRFPSGYTTALRDGVYF
mgnify:CR=1 FL=1